MAADARGGARAGRARRRRRRRCCARPRAADRARAAPRRRARSPPSVAPRSRRPRRDAALLAAAPPAARRRRRAARDDERQRLRRADRLRGRRRAASGWRAIADLVPRPRPPDPDAHRRLGRARGAPAARPLLLRRSRGYVPGSARAAASPAPRRVLACGAELKSTFCVAKGGRAWVGHHIGDLENYETLRVVPRRASSTSSGCSRSRPEVVAHDLHPDYLSTALRARARGRRARRASSTTTRTSPPAWPSTARPARRSARSSTAPGYGPRRDGLGRRAARRRPRRLRARRAPAGRCGCRAATRAVREPWRMACAWLVAALGEPSAAAARRARRRASTPARWRAGRRAGARPASPRRSTTSVGRLFDAVAALCGLRADGHLRGPGGGRARGGARPATSAAPTRCRVGATARARRARDDPRRRPRRRRRASAPGVVSARFHRALADATARACAEVAARQGIELVVLSGGVFQNPPPARGGEPRLEAAGLRVLVPERCRPTTAASPTARRRWRGAAAGALR